VEEVYDIRETLGSGNFAAVKLAIHKETGKRYALKMIDKRKYLKFGMNRKGTLMDEVDILKRISHPNIISIEEVFDSEQMLCIVLELVTGGELFDHIIECGYFDEMKARKLFLQITEAIHYLHQNGIAHRDLKPENILFTDSLRETLKLGDFGLSRMLREGSLMQTMCGTPQYLAPEVLLNNEQQGYSKKVDLWSLGTILYIMLSGSPPFEEGKGASLFLHPDTFKINFSDPIWSSVSMEAKDLIERMLCIDPELRYDASQVLQHPWITGNGIEELRVTREMEERKKEVQGGHETIETRLRKRKKEEAKDLSETNEEAKLLSPRAVEESNNGTDEKDEDHRRILSKGMTTEDDPRPLCCYGKSCYRKNPVHFREYRHPHLQEELKSSTKTKKER